MRRRQEKVVVEQAIEEPAWGQVRAANELKKKGITVSAAGVRCVWLRHDLETMKKRLKALETKSLQEGLVLTEAQVAALEKAKQDKRRMGNSRASVPGIVERRIPLCRDAQGGGTDLSTDVHRYVQQGVVKLYDRKTPVTAADLLNDRVLPFFEEHDMILSRVLTDRGTEFCGTDGHEYELYLAVEDIDHTRTKAKSSQTNGICERFHKTVLDEFYRVTFRKKIYKTLDELQADLDAWIKLYNEQRPHQGRWCYGKTPMQTFIDSIVLAKEKIIAA